MISNITNTLEFETDNKKFEEDQDELIEELDNVNPFVINPLENQNLNFDYSLYDTYDENNGFIISELEETEEETEPYYTLKFNSEKINFKDNQELYLFVNENSQFSDPYYIFNIPKDDNFVIVKMRNIDSIVKYLLNFHH